MFDITKFKEMSKTKIIFRWTNTLNEDGIIKNINKYRLYIFFLNILKSQIKMLTFIMGYSLSGYRVTFFDTRI